MVRSGCILDSLNAGKRREQFNKPSDSLSFRTLCLMNIRNSRTSFRSSLRTPPRSRRQRASTRSPPDAGDQPHIPSLMKWRSLEEAAPGLDARSLREILAERKEL